MKNRGKTRKTGSESHGEAKVCSQAIQGEIRAAGEENGALIDLIEGVLDLCGLSVARIFDEVRTIAAAIAETRFGIDDCARHTVHKCRSFVFSTWTEMRQDVKVSASPDGCFDHVCVPKPRPNVLRHVKVVSPRSKCFDGALSTVNSGTDNFSEGRYA